jgi:hypothetical protein
MIFKILREWIFKYIGTFFLEEKKNGKWTMSLGRTSFIILFILALYMWAPFLGIGSVVLPEDMLKLLILLASYNLGSKGVDVIKAYIESKKQKEQKEQEEPEEE